MDDVHPKVWAAEIYWLLQVKAILVSRGYRIMSFSFRRWWSFPGILSPTVLGWPNRKLIDLIHRYRYHKNRIRNSGLLLLDGIWNVSLIGLVLFIAGTMLSFKRNILKCYSLKYIIYLDESDSNVMCRFPNCPERLVFCWASNGCSVRGLYFGALVFPSMESEYLGPDIDDCSFRIRF